MVGQKETPLMCLPFFFKFCVKNNLIMEFHREVSIYQHGEICLPQEYDDSATNQSTNRSELVCGDWLLVNGSVTFE